MGILKKCNLKTWKNGKGAFNYQGAQMIHRFAVAIIALISMLFMTSLKADSQTATVDSEVNSIYTYPVNNPFTGAPAGVQPMPSASVEMQVRDGVENDQVNAINRSLYAEGFGTTDVNTTLINKHYLMTPPLGASGFCASSSVTETGAGYTCQSDYLLQHGDLKVTSIISGGRIGNIFAARAFLNNLVDPTPTSKYSSTDALKQAVGKGDPDLATALANQALLSVFRQPFMEAIEKRLPNSNIGDITYWEYIEKQAIQRQLNPQWANNIHSLSDPVALAQEQTLILAFQAWTNYLILKELQDLKLLTAANGVQINRATSAGSAAIQKTTTGLPPSS